MFFIENNSDNVAPHKIWITDMLCLIYLIV